MASSDEVELIVPELNKLKKSELIDIITLNKLPTGATNGMLSEFVDKVKEKKIFSDAEGKISKLTSNKHVCEQCSLWDQNNQKLRDQLDIMEKLVKHLEKRTLEQEDFISVLKHLTNLNSNIKWERESALAPSTSSSSNNDPNSTSMEIQNHSNLPTPTAAVLNGNSGIFSKRAPKALPPNSNNGGVVDIMNANKNIGSNKINKRDTKQVITKSQVAAAVNNIKINQVNSSKSRDKDKLTNNSSTKIIGTNTLNSSIKSIPSLGHIHLYKMSPETSKVDVLNYLAVSAPGIEFKCEPWNKTENYSTFKISFPLDKLDEVYKPNIWPHGAGVRRFKFNKNFQRNPTTFKRDQSSIGSKV